MKSAVAALVIVLALFVLLVGLPSRGTSGFSIVYPARNAPPAGVQRIVSFAATHDWSTELERAGAPTHYLETITDDLAESAAEVTDNRVMYRIDYQIASPLFSGWSMGSTVTVVQHRLQTEAYLLAWDDIAEPQGRRDVLWQAYGAGFDDRLREFLDQEIPKATDPELRAYMETMRSRL